MADKKEIIQKIKECIIQLHNKTDINGQTKWTEAFLEALTKLRENLNVPENITVYPNKKEGEFLLDLVWAKEEKDWKESFKGLLLACEIEWSRNTDDIVYDFQKLCVVDADIRLMIFQFDTEEEYTLFRTDIINASKNSVMEKGYSYLVAASGNKNLGLRFFEIKQDKQFSINEAHLADK